MNKTTVILNIYEDLLEGKIINMCECCVVYGISVPTFYRYLNVIRNHAMERHGREILCSQEKSGYFMERTCLTIKK